MHHDEDAEMCVNGVLAALRAVHVAVIASVIEAAALAAPPNILIYIADDHSQCDCSAYGDKCASTPALDALAADGMKLTQAYCASPSCAPSRAALLTGLMPARNGAEWNHTLPHPGTHSLVSDLKAAGYEVAAFGKVAHSGNVAPFGFDTVKLASDYLPLKNNVERYLQNRTSDKPLCLIVGIGDPHVPWTAPASTQPDSISLPPTFIDTPVTRRLRAAYYDEIHELDTFLGELRAMAAERLGPDMAFIYLADHGAQWPFGKWTLYDYGMRVPLLVHWPGVTTAGSSSDAMVSLIDLLPTVIELTGGTTPPGIDGRSFAAVLRGETRSHRDRIFGTHSGDGRMNVYPSRSIRTTQWKLIHNLNPEFAFTTHSDLDRKPRAGAYWTEWVRRSVESPEAGAIVNRYYQRPEFELYDVKLDPWEQHNLIDDVRCAAAAEGLKQELADWMLVQKDRQAITSRPRLLKNRLTWAPEYFGARRAGRPRRATTDRVDDGADQTKSKPARQ